MSKMSGLAPTGKLNTPLLVAIVAAILGLLLICIFGYYLFRPNLSGTLPNSQATPTVIQPTKSAEDDLAVYGQTEVDGKPVSLTISAPYLMTIGNRTFEISTERVTEGGLWAPSLNSNDSAVWVNGTVINYIIAIAYTEENVALMQTLEQSGDIVLKTRTDERLFSFNSREIVPVEKKEIFAQTKPGITIVLVGLGKDEPNRLVVQGRYQVDQSADFSAPTMQTQAIELGQEITLGQIKLNPLAFANKEQEGNFSHFLVDYQLTNQGTASFDTQPLVFALSDSAGNRYTTNKEASGTGNYLPLPESVESGQSVTATVGYQIPDGVNSADLTWVVEYAEEEAIVEVSDPTSKETESKPILAEVQLLTTGLIDASTILIEGQIRNNDTRTLTVQATDLSMTSESTVYSILSTSPGFPWIVEPNQEIPFTITAQRPYNTEQATVTILNQSFGLTIR